MTTIGNDETQISAYWLDLAQSLGYNRTRTAAQLVKDLYDVWDITKYPTFKEFVDEEVKKHDAD